MNRENSEIFSPDDLNQFQFSPSDKRISAVPKNSKKRGPRGPYKKKTKQ